MIECFPVPEKERKQEKEKEMSKLLRGGRHQKTEK
jgi:hypothetical protein